MRLRELLLVLALLLAPALQAEPLTRAEMQKAVDAVRAHPDLAGTTTEHELRWRDRAKPKEQKREEPSAFEWLRNLMRWMNETARLLVWAGGAVLVALLLVGLRRWYRVRGGRGPAQRAHLPSHVQSLDIRPESLPEDIGAAAAQLWQRGEQRAALSLLYRGALSRLVHGYAVPIRAASTEGECVALARGRLEAPRSAFFARLVQAWQLAVYGARLPSAEQALALCRDFDQQLPAAAARAA
ncbi:DUF4129 domain-containing protein [Ramlibacter agri]